MEFFEAQDQARKRTKWLLLWFLMAVVAVVLAVNILVLAVTGDIELLLANPASALGLVLPVTVGTAGLILGSSLFKSLQLRAGGEVVAKDLGGRLVQTGTTDHYERRLLNIVEEMAIASGMPVPQVYVMDHEEGINAFAAGTEPSNAVVGVTRGCMTLLDRDELSGVVAHEFSHILNGDMRLNMRLIGFIFGLVVISIIGRGVFEMMRFSSLSSRRDREGGGAAMAILAIGIGLMVIGGIGVFFGRLIQAAVSRQREYLADASAVQFTRNPDGIADALRKIGGLSDRNKLRTAKAGEASHMFFSDSGLFSFGLATHPPLAVRIKAILGREPEGFLESGLSEMEDPGQASAMVSGFSGGAGSRPRHSGLQAADIGLEERISQDHGRTVRAGLPPHWQELAHSSAGAQSLVFALLLAEDHDLARAELDYLEKMIGKPAAAFVAQLKPELEDLPSVEKIALIDLAMPTLRGVSRAEYERFRETMEHLIRADEKVELFEFMLQHLVRRHLESHFDPVGFPPVKYQAIQEVMEPANVVLSTMAGVGASGEREAQVAYQEAVGPIAGWQGELLKASSLPEIGQALEELEKASPLAKRDLLQGCARAVAADGVLVDREAELVRTVADALGCPVPPVLR